MLFRKSLISISAILVMAGLLNAYPGKVVKEFNAPGKFCTGMTFDGKYLWAADYKADKLFKIDPDNGKIISTIPSPGFWPMGLAWDGKHLWNVDKSQKKIFKIDPTSGEILDVIVDLPGVKPQGLAWDGSTLWLSDSKKNMIYKLDLQDGTAVKKLPAPAKRVHGLTFDGKYLWCTDRYEDEIYMVDPVSGEVLIITDAPGPFSRGLAWDGKHLWNVDFQNDAIYKLVRQDEERFKLSDTRKTRITFTHQVKPYGAGSLNKLETYLAIPEKLNQQKINSIDYSSEIQTKKDHWRQKIAVYKYQDIKAGSEVQSVMTVDAEISAIRYFIFPDQTGQKLSDIPSDILKLYTKDDVI